VSAGLVLLRAAMGRLHGSGPAGNVRHAEQGIVFSWT
jgi:hypothetical protein